MLRVMMTAGSLEQQAAGPSYSVPKLCEALATSGVDVRLLSLGRARIDYSLGFEHQFCPLTNATVPMLERLGSSVQMKQMVRSNKMRPNIYHTHGIWLMPNIYPGDIARSQNAKFVLSPRGMLSPEAMQYSKIKKLIFWHVKQKSTLQNVDMFHATSEQEYEDIRNLGFKQPITIIPNGIELPATSGLADLANQDKKVLLFLGRLHPIKQIENLLMAWSKLFADHRDWACHIVGSGEPSYVAKLNKLSTKLKLENCFFHGPVFGVEKDARFQTASLYVLPSKSENFAMTVVESLAAGTPVIASHGTPWKALQENGCGWWVNSSTSSLESSLREAMNLSSEELQTMGARGKKWVRREFSWKYISKTMVDAYRWISGAGDQPKSVKIT